MEDLAWGERAKRNESGKVLMPALLLRRGRSLFRMDFLCGRGRPELQRAETGLCALPAPFSAAGRINLHSLCLPCPNFHGGAKKMHILANLGLPLLSWHALQLVQIVNNRKIPTNVQYGPNEMLVKRTAETSLLVSQERNHWYLKRT